MNELPIKEKIKLSRITNWLIILAVFTFCLVYFQNILKPFILAVVFWYMISEFRDLLARIKVRNRSLPRWIRTTIAFLVLFFLIEIVTEILINNTRQILRDVPEFNNIDLNYIDEIGRSLKIEDLSGVIGDQISSIDLAGILTNILNSFRSMVEDIIMIIVYIIFLLIEEAGVSKKLRAIFQLRSDYENLSMVLNQISIAINKYITLKTIISLLAGVLCYLICILFKIDYPFLWAFITFVLNFIPYIGAFIATLLPALYAAFQFRSFLFFIWVFLAIEGLHMFIGNYVEPKFTGKSLNLSPLVVVIALTFWGYIWGIAGMILSVPIMSIITIILAQFPDTRFLAILLSETGDIKSLKVDNEKEIT
ncbi:MAG TPA: AI-2E family transporter [Cyclobacteriaceae bacterium]|nr:AI-2E family transporter [Cyclobacteriaceae bacterium]